MWKLSPANFNTVGHQVITKVSLHCVGHLRFMKASCTNVAPLSNWKYLSIKTHKTQLRKLGYSVNKMRRKKSSLIQIKCTQIQIRKYRSINTQIRKLGCSVIKMKRRKSWLGLLARTKQCWAMQKPDLFWEFLFYTQIKVYCMKILRFHENILYLRIYHSFFFFFSLFKTHVNQVSGWYDSFSDVPESRVWFASKNLTACRMHWNDFLIGQIIAECHSFPNMYDML